MAADHQCRSHVRGSLDEHVQTNQEQVRNRKERAADSVAGQAGEGPLVATVRSAADDSARLCLVSGQMVPSETAIHAQAVRLRALATIHGGDYGRSEESMAALSDPPSTDAERGVRGLAPVGAECTIAS